MLQKIAGYWKICLYGYIFFLHITLYLKWLRYAFCVIQTSVRNSVRSTQQTLFPPQTTCLLDNFSTKQLVFITNVAFNVIRLTPDVFAIQKEQIHRKIFSAMGQVRETQYNFFYQRFVCNKLSLKHTKNVSLFAR